MVAVSAPVDRPRIPHPLHVRLLHEGVIGLVGLPCPEVVLSTARACVPASRCLAEEHHLHASSGPRIYNSYFFFFFFSLERDVRATED